MFLVFFAILFLRILTKEEIIFSFLQSRNRRVVYMLSDLFFQVLLVICCTLFVSAHYASGSTGQPAVQKGVELFTTPAAISNIYNKEGTSNKNGDNLINPTDFYSPFLVATDNVIVALAGVNTADNSGDKFNLLTRYVEKKEGNEWLKEATNNKFDTNWQKQFAVKKDLEHKKI